MKLTKVNGIIRHLLTIFGGGAMATSGEDEIQLAAGAVSAILGLIWSWMAKEKNPDGIKIGDKKIPSILAMIGLSVSLTGCSITNPDTGEREFSRERTEQLKSIIQSEVSFDVAQLVSKNPDYADAVSRMRDVLCEMRDLSMFAPDILISGLNQALTEYNIVDDPTVFRIKNAIYALYNVFYFDEGHVELSDEKFMWNFLDLMCKSIDLALQDAMITSQR